MIARPTDDYSTVQHINMCRPVIRRPREKGRKRDKGRSQLLCVYFDRLVRIVKLLYVYVLEFDHITKGDRKL